MATTRQEYRRSYYQANKEKVSASIRKWVQDHPDYYVEYYNTHKEQMDLATKKYFAKNRIILLEVKISECTDSKKIAKLAAKLDVAKARLIGIEDRLNELRNKGADNV